MTPVPFYPNQKVAATWNNTGSLVAWELIKPTSDRYFFAPRVYGSFRSGASVYRLDGALYKRGWGSGRAVWPVITQAQVWYLMNTFCAGGYQGKVTMKFRTDDPATYRVVNCYLNLPDFPDADKGTVYFRNYTVTLTKVVIIG